MGKSDRQPKLTALNPRTEIAQVIESEAANLRSTRAALGERGKLATDVLELYELIRCQVNVLAGGDEATIGALLVMLPLLNCCRFQMTMSILQNWRGRTAEALGPLRKATEL